MAAHPSAKEMAAENLASLGATPSAAGIATVLNLVPERVVFPCYGASDSWADQTFCASAAVAFTGTGEITALTLRQNAASPDPLDGVIFLFFSASPGIALDAAVTALTAAIMSTCIGAIVIDSSVNPDKFMPTSAAAHMVHKPDTSIMVTNGAAVWCVGFNNTGGALATSGSESIDAVLHYSRRS